VDRRRRARFATSFRRGLVPPRPAYASIAPQAIRHSGFLPRLQTAAEGPRKKLTTQNQRESWSKAKVIESEGSMPASADVLATENSSATRADDAACRSIADETQLIEWAAR
jgi:hypothetical protein